MKKVKVGKSKIHGNGLFADEPIKRGDVIELVHTIRELEPGVIKTTPTLLGRNYNHSDDSNALNVVDGNNRYLVALKEIEAGGEITTDYRTNPDLEQPGSFTTNDNYISFDYDDTLTTPEGFKLAQQMNKEGKNLYVITARDKVTPQMIERAEAAGIPKENIITAGSDEAKVRIIKENNINKHIDNKDSVIKALGDKGELFVPDAYPDLKADFVEMELSDDDLNKLREGGFIIDKYPNAKYYQDGGVTPPEDYSQFQTFAETLPSNLQDPSFEYGNPDQYDLYGMWETVGKPGSFADVQDSEYFPLDEDGTYHGFTVGADGTFLKPMSHNTTWKEVMNSQLSLDPYFQENRLIRNEQGRLQYIPKAEYGMPLGAGMFQNYQGRRKFIHQDGGIISQEEIDAGNNAMMKARLAYAYMHGNPAAQRMVVAPDQPYDFGDGMTGTHYMASMDNYAVPQIQDVNGQLMLGDYGPDSMEAIRFDNPEDAEYFAEHYKEITPDASYRKDKYPDGGLVEVRGYEGNKFRKNANGKWEYESGRPVEDPLLIYKLTYESKPVGSPVVQGAPKPVINQTVWENAAGTSQKNAIAREKQLQALKMSPKIADQELAQQIEQEKANAQAAYEFQITQNMQYEQPLDMMDWLWQVAAFGPTVAPGAWTAAETVGSAALPYLQTAFNTSLPGMSGIAGATYGNALASGFAGDAIVNRLLPAPGKIQEGEYGEAAADVATGVLDLWGANMLSPAYNGVKATASELGKLLGTEEGLLSNAYKVNPFAFKANPEAYYRVLGKDGVTDAIESGIIRANQKNVHPFSGEPIYDRPYFSKGVIFDRDWTALNRSKGSPTKGVTRGKPTRKSFYPDDNMVEIFGHDRFHPTNDLVTTPSQTISSFDEGLKFYKRDWLKGYKEVPKELPGSPNTFKSSLGGMDMSKYEIKNPDYFTKLLDTYDSRKLSPTNKNFYKGLIESVKKQNGIATERQYNELQRLRTGNFNFGKKGYSNGGSINQFGNQGFDNKLNKFIR